MSVVDADRNGVPRQYAAEGLRPQTLLFTLLGRHIRPVQEPVASSTFLEVLGRLGVSVQAARSTLTRMVWRGHLERTRVGRRAYFSISDKLRGVLAEGGQRIFEPPVRNVPEDVWTLLSFSIPEHQRADRHSLRTALAWKGFGLLRNGLWIAPGDIDVSPIVDKLDLQDHIEVFAARPSGPTDLTRVVNEAWDLDEIAEGYRRFVEEWEQPLPAVEDGHLAPQIRLITQWQQILVDDPELPPRYLPDDWPAMRAYELFLRVEAALSPGAHEEFSALLEVLDVPAGDGSTA